MQPRHSNGKSSADRFSQDNQWNYERIEQISKRRK